MGWDRPDRSFFPHLIEFGPSCSTFAPHEPCLWKYRLLSSILWHFNLVPLVLSRTKSFKMNKIAPRGTFLVNTLYNCRSRYCSDRTIETWAIFR